MAWPMLYPCVPKSPLMPSWSAVPSVEKPVFQPAMGGEGMLLVWTGQLTVSLVPGVVVAVMVVFMAGVMAAPMVEGMEEVTGYVMAAMGDDMRAWEFSAVKAAAPG